MHSNVDFFIFDSLIDILVHKNFRSYIYIYIYMTLKCLKVGFFTTYIDYKVMLARINNYAKAFVQQLIV